MRARPRAPALLLALGLALTACGDDGAAGAPDDADVGTREEPVDAAVGVAETDIGEILVDSQGRTLYALESDEQGEPTCYDDCADQWPPMLAEDPAAAEGADADLVGTTTRDDDRDQATYNDWPLYYWSGDGERGDTDGQGVEGVWWVLDDEGRLQRDTDGGATGADEADDNDNDTDGH